MIQLKNQLVIFDILSCMMWICGVGVDLWCRCGSVVSSVWICGDVEVVKQLIVKHVEVDR